MDDGKTISQENIVNLNSEKSRKKSKQKPDDSPSRPSKAELYFAVIQAINRTPMRTLPELRLRLYVTEPSAGSRQILCVNDDDDTCHVVPLSFVVSEIGHYLDTTLLGVPEYVWEYRHMLDCARRWLAVTPPTPMPKKVRFKTEIGLCFQRLPFDLTQDEERVRTPTWDELFSRMTNARAVKAWIGSLFVDASDRQQYVFLYGKGNDGKGSLARFLLKVFGLAGETQATLPRLSNKHWAVPYEGKRLVVFPDFDDYESMTSGLVKTLTGDDPAHVERKYEAGYMTKLVCKLLFCSNKMPSISSLKADQRRIIFAEMTSTDEDDPRYGARLWAEGGAFLWDCITTYGELCPRHTRIPSEQGDDDAAVSWAAAYDQEFEYVFNTYFAKLHQLPGQDENAYRLSWADPHDVQKRLHYHWPHKRGPQLAFLNWMREQGHARSRVQIETHGQKKLVWKYRDLGLSGSSSSTFGAVFP